MTKPEPRDVIAQEVASWWDESTDAYKHHADAILAALDAAGFVIVPKGEWRRNVPLSDVLAEREPPQKPQPDWGRKGTQPKGTLGEPPPPNGKRVASKPLPMTGPFNPFGKQDDE